LGADCAAAGPECFFWVQTVQTFGCRLCSNGPGMFFLGADCADFGCRLCSSGPGMNLLGADCADFGCRMCRLWVQTVQTMDELEIPKVGGK